MSTLAIIDDLRKMMIMSGKMSDLHYANLQGWGQLVFSDYESVEIEYDIKTTDPKKYRELTGHSLKSVDEKAAFGSTITYRVKTKKGKRITKKQAETALNSLKLWIGHLFWSDIQVQIFINKKEYKGLS